MDDYQLTVLVNTVKKQIIAEDHASEIGIMFICLMAVGHTRQQSYLAFKLVEEIQNRGGVRACLISVNTHG